MFASSDLGDVEEAGDLNGSVELIVVPLAKLSPVVAARRPNLTALSEINCVRGPGSNSFHARKRKRQLRRVPLPGVPEAKLPNRVSARGPNLARFSQEKGLISGSCHGLDTRKVGKVHGVPTICCITKAERAVAVVARHPHVAVGRQKNAVTRAGGNGGDLGQARDSGWGAARDLGVTEPEAALRISARAPDLARLREEEAVRLAHGHLPHGRQAHSLWDQAVAGVAQAQLAVGIEARRPHLALLGDEEGHRSVRASGHAAERRKSRDKLWHASGLRVSEAKLTFIVVADGKRLAVVPKKHCMECAGREVGDCQRRGYDRDIHAADVLVSSL